jgi:hypothetical protein
LKSWVTFNLDSGQVEDPMTKSELKQFQTVLTARVAELERLTRRRDTIMIDRSSDELEEIHSKLRSAHLQFVISTCRLRFVWLYKKELPADD